MKSILLLILVSLIQGAAFSQVVQEQLRYDTCALSSYARFAGEWIYINQQDTVRIQLRPVITFNL